MNLVGIVIKVTLNQYHGSTLVARAAGKIAKRADQVGQLTGGGTLGCHIAHKVVVLGADACGDSLLERVTRKILEIVVGKVFKLKLVGRTDQTVGITAFLSRSYPLLALYPTRFRE